MTEESLAIAMAGADRLVQRLERVNETTERHPGAVLRVHPERRDRRLGDQDPDGTVSEPEQPGRLALRCHGPVNVDRTRNEPREKISLSVKSAPDHPRLGGLGSHYRGSDLAPRGKCHLADRGTATHAAQAGGEKLPLLNNIRNHQVRDDLVSGQDVTLVRAAYVGRPGEGHRP